MYARGLRSYDSPVKRKGLNRRELAVTSDTGDDMVQAWAEEVVIPTYGVGQPEKNPIFLEKRVYQGSSGAVYPHPVIERVARRAPAAGVDRRIP